MKIADAKIGIRVWTNVSMASNKDGWLAARRGTIVEIRPDTYYQVKVNIDGFQHYDELPEGQRLRCNPVPFHISELEIGRAPWEC